MNFGINIAAGLHFMGKLQAEAIAEKAISASLASGGGMEILRVREKDVTLVIQALIEGRDHELEPTELSVPSLDVFGWDGADLDSDWMVRIIFED